MQTPRWIWITLPVLAGCGWQLNGQTSIDLTRQGRLGSGTTLPAQCAVGQVFFKSDAPAGANLYTCVAQNSWTAAGLSQIDAAGTPLTVRPTLNFGGGATCVDNSGANRTDCTFSGGGSGFVILTTGSGAPPANCAPPSSSNLAVYLDTANQEEWWCSAANTWKKILSVTGTGPYGVAGSTGVAPGVPSSGNLACYFDSTTNTQVCLDSSGNAFTMVKGASAVSHQFVTNVDTGGIQHLAQPAFSDLSGATTYKTITCQPGLGDGLNAISAGTYLMSGCLNDFGSTWTVTAIKCFTDNNGTSTLNVTNSAGTGLLTGAVTCSNSWAAGTQSSTTTLAAADWTKLTLVADGTSKQATFVITGTR